MRKNNEDDRIKPPIFRGVSSDALLAKVEKIRKSVLNKQPWLWDKTSGVLLQGKNHKLEGLFEKLECTPLVCNSGLTLACDSKSFIDAEHGFKKSVGVEIRVVEVENQKDVHSGLFSEASVYGAYKFKGVGRNSLGGGNDSVIVNKMDMDQWTDGNGTRIDAFLSKRGILRSCDSSSIDAKIENYLNSDSSVASSSIPALDDTGVGGASLHESNSAPGVNACVRNLTTLQCEVKEQIMNFISNGPSVDSGFLVDVNSSFVDSYRTRHYSVSMFRENSGREFRKGSVGYWVKIQRTILVATIDPTIKVGFHVPLCEEFVVWLYEIKDHVPVLKDTALVIHAKPQMTRAGSLTSNDSRASHWHFFGNNAFSVHQNADHAIKNNISETSLFMAGFISGRLIDLKTRDRGVVTQSVCLFANVFNDVPQDCEFSNRYIDKDSYFMKRVSSYLYKKHEANIKKQNENSAANIEGQNENSAANIKKQNENSAANSEGGQNKNSKVNVKGQSENRSDEQIFFEKVESECIPKRTFLSSQQLGKMTTVRIIDSKPASPCMRMCFASFSISMVVLGPRDDANVNAVFVGSVDMPVEPQMDTVKRVVPISLNVKSPSAAVSAASGGAGEETGIEEGLRTPPYFKDEPPTFKDGNMRRNGTWRSNADGSASVKTTAYQSSLPLELELELELL